MIEITLDGVDRAAHDIVSIQPNYIYLKDVNDGCHYVRNGRASCLVGRILNALGVPLETLSQHEGLWSAGMLDELTASGVIAKPSQDVRYFLNELQMRQDNGETWANAMFNARSVVISE